MFKSIKITLETMKKTDGIYVLFIYVKINKFYIIINKVTIKRIEANNKF